MIFRIQTGWWKYFFLLPWAYYSSPYQLAGFLCLFQIWSKYNFADSVINFVPKYKFTVPALIKDAASIQKLFFQSSTMVQFCQISSIFSIFDCTNFNKTHLLLVNFWVRLLFKSVLYWRGYGIFCIIVFNLIQPCLN